MAQAGEESEALLRELQRLNRTIEGIATLSDYEVAILGAAVIESALHRALGVRLRLDAAERVAVLDKSPLSGLMNKVDLARNLNLIDKALKTNIQNICEIRNKFGHLDQVLSFDTVLIVKLCDKLKGSEVFSKPEEFNAMKYGLPPETGLQALIADAGNQALIWLKIGPKETPRERFIDAAGWSWYTVASAILLMIEREAIRELQAGVG